MHSPKSPYMTKLLTMAVALMAFSCNTPSNEAAKTEAAPATPAKHDYGVKVSYSTDFVIGDPALGDKVVAVWKSYDANTLASVKDHFADSVDNDLPGYKAKVSRDTLIAQVSAMRSALTSCVSEFTAIVPLKANDKDESVVCVWGKETTEAGGKKNSRQIQEVWGFNKEGKITWIKQYQL